LAELAGNEKKLLYQWIKRECGQCQNCFAVTNPRTKRFAGVVVAVAIGGVTLTWLVVQQLHAAEIKSRLQQMEETTVTLRHFYQYMESGQNNLEKVVE
jgi:dissimilatory sulfite reductase (desulfoviridin) alpha/beta subunit